MTAIGEVGSVRFKRTGEVYVKVSDEMKKVLDDIPEKEIIKILKEKLPEAFV